MTMFGQVYLNAINKYFSINAYLNLKHEIMLASQSKCISTNQVIHTK